AVELLLDLTQELGTRALPAPVADAFVAAILNSELSSRISSGDARVIAHIGTAEQTILAFGATEATDVLLLDPSSMSASVAKVTKIMDRTELSFQSAAEISVGKPTPLKAPTELVERSIAVLLVAQGTRVLGAIRRGHELAVEHAKT